MPNTRDAPPTDLGIAVKAWIALLMFLNGWNIVRTSMVIKDLVDHSDPRWKGPLSWALPSAIGLSVAMIVALAVVLIGRKVGIYLAATVAIAAFAINLYLRLPPTNALMGLVGIGILIGLLLPRWSALR